MAEGSPPRWAKRAFAGALDGAGVLRADLATRSTTSAVAINYHGTPPSMARRLEAHFAFYRDRFECLDEDGLLAFLGGSRRLRRPGLVLCFDDGLADNFRVAAPRLEQAGLCGWFMVPGGFLDRPEGEQAAYFRRHIGPPAAAAIGDGDLAAMTWEQARGLVARGHAVGCHTWSHRTLGPEVPRGVVHEEVVVARARLEDRLGRAVRTFSWARGRPEDYSAPAHRAIAGAFALAFTTMSRAMAPGDCPHLLHRFHVDASYSLPAVRLQISRINEAWFARRRRRVEALADRPGQL